VASISQNQFPDALPDFRNLGVIARLLIAVNLAAFGVALYAVPDWEGALERFLAGAVLLEPLLLASLIALYAATPALARLPYWPGCAAVLAITLAIAALAHLPWFAQALQPSGGVLRTLALTALATALLLAYLRLHLKAHSPALAEARLQALQARIRPHFLFNSLNAVLSLIRRDPRRAERSLEDLADLFRTLMSDGRGFVRLADEIALLERYASLEELRLGERLRVVWELDAAPSDALLPPLVLQPLLENAVYHGVEPGAGPGEVVVRIERVGERVRVHIENTLSGEPDQRVGNRMALDNIRERLVLFFDAEARIDTRQRNGRYCVEIEMPYRTRSHGAP
jgi:two-component system sensor histidine kinase AlgZ